MMRDGTHVTSLSLLRSQPLAVPNKSPPPSIFSRGYFRQMCDQTLVVVAIFSSVIDCRGSWLPHADAAGELLRVAESFSSLVISA